MVEATLVAQGYTRVDRPISRSSGKVYRIVQERRGVTVEWYEIDQPRPYWRGDPERVGYIRGTLESSGVVELVPDERSARRLLEEIRWPDGPICPDCGTGDRIAHRPWPARYRCYRCGVDFGLRTGSPLERSKLRFRETVLALFLWAVQGEELGGVHVAAALHTTQKSIWHLFQRFRQAVLPGALEGLVDGSPDAGRRVLVTAVQDLFGRNRCI